MHPTRLVRREHWSDWPRLPLLFGICVITSVDTTFPGSFEVNSRPDLRVFFCFFFCTKKTTRKNGCVYRGFRIVNRCFCRLRTKIPWISIFLCSCQKFKHKPLHTFQRRIGERLPIWRRFRHLKKTSCDVISCVLYVCDNLGPLCVRAISESKNFKTSFPISWSARIRVCKLWRFSCERAVDIRAAVLQYLLQLRGKCTSSLNLCAPVPDT